MLCHRGSFGVISSSDLASRGRGCRSRAWVNRDATILQMMLEHGPETMIEPVAPELVSRITGRDRSLFAIDLERYRRVLEQMCASSRILVIGAAGSIGAAVVK